MAYLRILKWWKQNLVFCLLWAVGISPSCLKEHCESREKSWSHDIMWVYVDGQACSDGGSQAYHLPSTGSLGRPDCGCRLSQTFSLCSQAVYHQPANQPRMLHAQLPSLGKGCVLRGISHVAPILKIHHRGWQKGWDEGRVGLQGKSQR